MRQLREALSDPETLGTIPPALAANFGVIPIRVMDSCAIIGHVPDICPDCLTFLERYFERDIQPVPLDSKIVFAAIIDAYLKDQTVNHDTFPAPDFILKAENETKLLNEKRDEIGPVIAQVPDGKIVFLETSYWSEMRCLDRQEEEEDADIGSESIPFKLSNGRPIVAAPRISPNAFLLERRNYSYEGCHNRHGILRVEVDSLPHIIHPSEIQLTQVREDGSATFYSYDSLVDVAPGTQATLQMEYYFISFGCRYHRKLLLKIHTLEMFDRESIEYVDDEIPWDLEDTRRWLGIDG